ncbi:MAG: 5-dehydro-2-deoxygluconokinase [Deltaproteobacteria bacterium]|nr:5-dehydro-2-deoxygluconokinase [Deltaproteobacteria bacterium]
MTDRALDLICLGRAAVDLYAEQLGSPLEDARSFAMSLGGCPANIAVGAARLGLKVAMVTRVGDEHLGRFVRAALAAEGVDVDHVRTDPHGLTGLAILGIRGDSFPLVFYRESCADMALRADDFDRAFIGSARALLVTGTHLSTPSVLAASRAAIAHARAAGTRVVLDIDYRPVLWGHGGHACGESRFVAAEAVTRTLGSVLPDCDLVVGTEEEIHVAGGSTGTIAALRAIRARTGALVVMKRGREGCVAFEGTIPPTLDEGLVSPGVEIAVCNVLGAGDAFMAGLLDGWIRGEGLVQACRRANAAGALVVSRHGCAPAMPSRAELDALLSDRRAEIEHLHRVASRPSRSELMVLAFDHRTQLEELCRKARAPLEKLRPLKILIARAARETAVTHGILARAGMLIDERWGAGALLEHTGSGLWLGRPIERPGSDATEWGLEFEGGADVGVTLRSWPRDHVVKCLVAYHPGHPRRRGQELLLGQLWHAVRSTGHELLLEVIPKDREGKLDAAALPRALDGIYSLGIRPDWWKLPAPAADGWGEIERVIVESDPSCRGVLLLGLDAPEEVVANGFRAAAAHSIVRGFAVGRTIFSGPSAAWLAGEIDDTSLVAGVSAAYGRMIQLWQGRGR